MNKIEIKNDTFNAQSVVIAILLVLFIALTLGAFYKTPQQLNKKDLKKRSTQKLLVEEKEKLKEIERKIKQLENRKNELELREKRIMLGSRLGLGALLVAGNLVYLSTANQDFDLGNQLNFNSAILLIYGFAGFLLYGSLQKLVRRVKAAVVGQLRKKDIHIWHESEVLKSEKKETINRIKNLEKVFKNHSHGTFQAQIN
jgi:hypothetical protein